jgi:hypothetical protein
MGAEANTTITAFNAYVDQLKEVKGAQIVFTLVTFTNWHSTVYDAVPIQDVVPLTSQNYRPTGGTDLCAALVYLMDKIEKKSKGQRIVITMQTDGQTHQYHGENERRSFGSLTKELAQKRKLGWDFVFMGADMPLFAARSMASGHYGIDEAHTLAYNQGGVQTERAFAAAATSASAFVTQRADKATFTPEQMRGGR